MLKTLWDPLKLLERKHRAIQQLPLSSSANSCPTNQAAGRFLCYSPPSPRAEVVSFSNLAYCEWAGKNPHGCLGREVRRDPQALCMTGTCHGLAHCHFHPHSDSPLGQHAESLQADGEISHWTQTSPKLMLRTQVTSRTAGAADSLYP